MSEETQTSWSLSPEEGRQIGNTWGHLHCLWSSPLGKAVRPSLVQTPLHLWSFSQRASSKKTRLAYGPLQSVIAGVSQNLWNRRFKKFMILVDPPTPCCADRGQLLGGLDLSTRSICLSVLSNSGLPSEHGACDFLRLVWPIGKMSKNIARVGKCHSFTILISPFGQDHILGRGNNHGVRHGFSRWPLGRPWNRSSWNWSRIRSWVWS